MPESPIETQLLTQTKASHTSQATTQMQQLKARLLLSTISNIQKSRDKVVVMQVMKVMQSSKVKQDVVGLELKIRQFQAKADKAEKEKKMQAGLIKLMQAVSV